MQKAEILHNSHFSILRKFRKWLHQAHLEVGVKEESWKVSEEQLGLQVPLDPSTIRSEDWSQSVEKANGASGNREQQA